MNVLGELRFRLGSFRQAKELHRQLHRERRRAAQAERELRQTNNANQRLKKQSRDQQKLLEQKDATLKRRGVHLEPSQLIWIFGNPRTGSTWLSQMMADIHTNWNEPYIGSLFGAFANEQAHHFQRGKHFILGGKYETQAIRQFVLWSAGDRFPDAEYVAIKEPNGSAGAALISKALPESSFVFLIRDPRDVVASTLDANLPGGRRAIERERQGLEPEDPAKLVPELAGKYAQRISASKEAFDAHKGPKVQLSYEELRREPVKTLVNLYAELGIAVERSSVEAAVEWRSWENISEERKGSGKGKRKATPGGFREDLTQEQIAEVERITGPLMDELGYESVT